MSHGAGYENLGIMKNIIRIAIVVAVAVLFATDIHGAGKTPQQSYIERYASLAVSEMYRSGVPASITLAQGLLESRYGQSELALKSNNHFGIKCHNWTGAKVYHDDDRRNDCFRKYSSPDESFRDHSDFLRYRDRYRFLFDMSVTDYKGWAYGLRKAGYATDPAYPEKLIRLIEEHRLYEFDRKAAGWTASSGKNEETADVARQSVREARKEARRASRKHDKKSHETPEQAIPQSPGQIEQVKVLTPEQSEVFHFALSRQMYSQNGVPFIYSCEGETYASIAKCYKLFLRELLKFNDLESESYLAPGTVVYLQAKKKEAPSGLDKYVVEGEADLRDIAQRFAVRMESLYKMNAWEPGYAPVDGDVIILRSRR